MTRVALRKVSKKFGEVVAVDKASIEVDHGEFFTLLGPSGCGKTTTLRIVAGFEIPDEGSVFFDNEDVTLRSRMKEGVPWCSKTMLYGLI